MWLQGTACFQNGQIAWWSLGRGSLLGWSLVLDRARRSVLKLLLHPLVTNQKRTDRRNQNSRTIASLTISPNCTALVIDGPPHLQSRMYIKTEWLQGSTWFQNIQGMKWSPARGYILVWSLVQITYLTPPFTFSKVRTWNKRSKKVVPTHHISGANASLRHFWWKSGGKATNGVVLCGQWMSQHCFESRCAALKHVDHEESHLHSYSWFVRNHILWLR